MQDFWMLLRGQREVVSLLHELIAVKDGKIVDVKHRSVPQARVKAT